MGTFDWNVDSTGTAAPTGYTIAKNLTILGYGESNTIIQAHATADTADRRVFTITTSSTVTFQSLTIRNGKDAGASLGWNRAGGIHVENGSVINLTNCTVENNRCVSTSGGYGLGGGISVQDWDAITINISSCTFKNNYAYGAAYIGGAIRLHQSKSLNVDNSTFENNEAYCNQSVFNTYSLAGGAIYSYRFATFNIKNSTFVDNTADAGGSAIFTSYMTGVYLTNNTIAGNTYNGCPPCDQRICSRPTGAGDSNNRDLGAFELGAPLHIDLVSFTAKRLPAHVKVEWETETEVDTSGFHVWRADGRNKDFVRVTDWLVPAVGGPAQGAEYLWQDSTAVSGTQYWYKLEEISDGGLSNYHGPVKAMGKKPGSPGN